MRVSALLLRLDGLPGSEAGDSCASVDAACSAGGAGADSAGGGSDDTGSVAGGSLAAGASGPLPVNCHVRYSAGDNAPRSGRLGGPSTDGGAADEAAGWASVLIGCASRRQADRGFRLLYTTKSIRTCRG